MIQIRKYSDLQVWQKAVDLAVDCYRVVKSLPKVETYGLVSQIQRAATSIPANIAEGHGREHLGDYLRFLSAANGSLMELETHLLVAQRLDYFKAEELDGLFKKSSEVGRMLNGLTTKLKAKSAR